MERSGKDDVPRPLTPRRLAALAFGMSILPFALTAKDSWSLWRGAIALFVAWPFMALGLLLVRRSRISPRLAGITIVLSMPFLCSIGIGGRLPERGGDGPPAPTGTALVGLLMLVVLGAFAVAIIVVLFARRAEDA